MVNFSIICGKDRLSLPICTLSKDGEKKASLFYPTFSLFALWWGDLDPHAYDIVDLIFSFSLYLVVGWFWPSCLSHTWSSLSLFVLWWGDCTLDPPFLSLPCGGMILTLMHVIYLILPFSLCVCGGVILEYNWLSLSLSALGWGDFDLHAYDI